MDCLPAEVRHQILKNLIPNGKRIWWNPQHRYWHIRDRLNFPKALMLVCKTLTEDCATIFYGQNHFNLRGTQLTVWSFIPVPHRYRSKVRRIEFELGLCDSDGQRSMQRDWIPRLVITTVIAYPNLDELKLWHIGGELDGQRWSNPADFNAVWHITHAPSSLQNGKVFLEKNGWQTYINRRDRRYKVDENKLLIDMESDAKAGCWVLKSQMDPWSEVPMSETDPSHFDPSLCGDGNKNCFEYWFEFPSGAESLDQDESDKDDSVAGEDTAAAASNSIEPEDTVVVDGNEASDYRKGFAFQYDACPASLCKITTKLKVDAQNNHNNKDTGTEAGPDCLVITEQGNFGQNTEKGNKRPSSQYEIYREETGRHYFTLWPPENSEAVETSSLM